MVAESASGPGSDAAVAPATPQVHSQEPPVSVEAVRDPVPVQGSASPAQALNEQVGGSGAPARGGRSLVVVKRKKALDASSLDAGRMANEFVRRGQASVKQCFEARRAKDPAAKGLLTLRFAVDTKGAVVDVTVEGFHADVVECVRTAMPTWVFATPDMRTRFELVLDLVIG